MGRRKKSAVKNDKVEEIYWGLYDDEDASFSGPFPTIDDAVKDIQEMIERADETDRGGLISSNYKILKVVKCVHPTQSSVQMVNGPHPA